MPKRFFAAGAVVAAAFAATMLTAGPAGATMIPAPAVDAPPAHGTQVAVFAGGCFWGMEGLFEQVKGVKSVTSGYAGGTKDTATYAQVSTETTGHAESVRVVYDPAVVSYGTLLRVFFASHNPTTLNYQEPDRGPSYRSAIFAQNPEQRRVAQAYIAQLDKSHAFPRAIVTKIETGNFYPAEAYHQHFFERNPDQGYIVHWDKPKVASFRATYPQLAK